MYKLNGGDTEWDGVKTKTGSTSKNMVIVLTIQNLIPQDLLIFSLSQVGCIDLFCMKKDLFIM